MRFTRSTRAQPVMMVSMVTAVGRVVVAVALGCVLLTGCGDENAKARQDFLDECVHMAATQMEPDDVDLGVEACTDRAAELYP